MKKTILILIMLTWVLYGCTPNIKDKRDNMLFDIERIKKDTFSVEIQDAFDGLFFTPIRIKVDNTEKEKLIKMLDELTPNSKGFSKSVLYSISYLDESGNTLGFLTVDLGKTLLASNNVYYRRDNLKTAVLDEIEQKYELNASLLERRPGNNFFKLLCYADHGSIYEITENNFVKGLDLDISSEDVKNFEKAVDQVSFASEKETVTPQYVVEIYTRDGGIVCRLFKVASGEFFTDSGYKIERSSLVAWFEDCIK